MAHIVEHWVVKPTPTKKGHSYPHKKIVDKPEKKVFLSRK
jgi:hypothetical protein